MFLDLVEIVGVFTIKILYAVHLWLWSIVSVVSYYLEVFFERDLLEVNSIYTQIYMVIDVYIDIDTDTVSWLVTITPSTNCETGWY